MPEVQTSKAATVTESLNDAAADIQLARQMTFDAFKKLNAAEVPFPLRDHAARITSDLDAFMAEIALFHSGSIQNDGGHQ